MVASLGDQQSGRRVPCQVVIQRMLTSVMGVTKNERLAAPGQRRWVWRRRHRRPRPQLVEADKRADDEALLCRAGRSCRSDSSASPHRPRRRGRRRGTRARIRRGRPMPRARGPRPGPIAPPSGPMTVPNWDFAPAQTSPSNGNYSVVEGPFESRNCPEYPGVFDNSRRIMTEGLPQTRPRLDKFG